MKKIYKVYDKNHKNEKKKYVKKTLILLQNKRG